MKQQVKINNERKITSTTKKKKNTLNILKTKTIKAIEAFLKHHS